VALNHFTVPVVAKVVLVHFRSAPGQRALAPGLVVCPGFETAARR
jgi:hypothetical protein